MTQTSDLHPGEAAYYASINILHDWHVAADVAMRYLISTNRPFSADDLRYLLREAGEPATPNAWGGLFISYARQGYIRRCGGGPSGQAKRNSGFRYMWIANNQQEGNEE